VTVDDTVTNDTLPCVFPCTINEIKDTVVGPAEELAEYVLEKTEMVWGAEVVSILFVERNVDTVKVLDG
jgi:hypothetical protein